MRLSCMITTPPSMLIALPRPQTVEFSIRLSLASVNVPPDSKSAPPTRPCEVESMRTLPLVTVRDPPCSATAEVDCPSRGGCCSRVDNRAFVGN
eukprot:7378806-Prymnesium_polylepis.1